jgi:transposase
MAKLTEEQRIRIISLSDQGKKQREIAAEVGCSQTEVSFTVRHFTAYHTVRDLPRSGRPRKLDNRDVRVLRRQLRTKTFAAASGDIVASGYGNVSKWTITRALRRRGMRTYVVQKKSDLNAARALTRLKFVRPRKNLSPHNWTRYIFTDECLVKAKDTVGKQHVWLEKNTAFGRDRALSTSRFGLASVMVWGAITASGHAYIVPVNGTLNGLAYIALLKNNLPAILARDFSDAQQAGRRPIFQQDNAPCHRVKGVFEYVKGTLQLGHHQWPPYSPDLNPIENFWKEFKAEIWRGQNLRNRADLLARINTVATELRTGAWKEKIVNLYETMPNRMAAVIASKGWQTKY